MDMNKTRTSLLSLAALALAVLVGWRVWHSDEHAPQGAGMVSAQTHAADRRGHETSVVPASATTNEGGAPLALSARSAEQQAWVLRGLSDRPLDRLQVAASAARGMAPTQAEPEAQSTDSRQYVSPFSK